MEHQENQRQQGIEEAPDSLLQGVLHRLEQRNRYLTDMPVQDLVDALSHPQWEIRSAAVRALSVRDSEQASSDALLTALHDEHRLVRAAAVHALGQYMPMEHLLFALQDPDWEVREMAVTVLGEFGEQAPDPLRALLLTALHDSHANVRDAAAYALNQHDAIPISSLPSATIHQQAIAEQLLPAQQSSPHPTLASRLARIGRVFYKQLPLMHKSIWIVTPLLMLFWYILVSFRNSPDTASLYLALITTVSAAAGAAFLYGGENDAGFELTLATPTSMRSIMFYRFLLVVGYNVLFSAGASALVAFSHGGSMWEIIALWLGPMLLLSSFALTLSMLIGSWFALSAALILEISQSFIINKQDHWPVLEFSLSGNWQTSPTILGLAALLIILAILYAARQPRLSL